MEFESINHFFETVNTNPYLCTSCGMCVGVCPTDAVTMQLNQFNQFVPLFDEELCVGCNYCVESCPGIDIRNDHKDIGDYHKIYLAWANDSKYRTNGSSGGVVSALSSWLLSTGYVSNVLTLNSSNNPITPNVIDVKSADSILQCAGSKYIAYPICVEIDKFNEKSLITTLPCQTSAIKKANLNNGIIFGLFCSKAYTADLIKYLSIQESIKTKEIKSINYREGNWPGQVSIKTPNKDVQIPLAGSYYTAISNGYYFSIQGCLLCPDYFNENADISFGDPWGFKVDQGLSLGKSVVIVRSEKGKEIIDLAIANNVITVEEITREQLLKGHQSGVYIKKSSIGIRLNKIKKMGLPLPEFNQKLIPNYDPLQYVIQDYYIKNSILLKKRYESIFKINKWLVFINRYMILIIQKMYLKINSITKKKNKTS